MHRTYSCLITYIIIILRDALNPPPSTGKENRRLHPPHSPLPSLTVTITIMVLYDHARGKRIMLCSTNGTRAFARWPFMGRSPIERWPPARGGGWVIVPGRRPPESGACAAGPFVRSTLGEQRQHAGESRATATRARRTPDKGRRPRRRRRRWRRAVGRRRSSSAPPPTLPSFCTY